MPKIFISYRREDSADAAGRIHDKLGPHFGPENVFFDVNNIPFGADFRQHLDQAVGKCGVLLAIIGEGWLDSRYREGPRAGQRRLDDQADFVRIEVESALRRNIVVIPVLVGSAKMPSEGELPEVLRPLAFRNAAEVRSGRDFHDHVARLIRGIEHLPDQERLQREEAKRAGEERQQRKEAGVVRQRKEQEEQKRREEAAQQQLELKRRREQEAAARQRETEKRRQEMELEARHPVEEEEEIEEDSPPVVPKKRTPSQSKARWAEDDDDDDIPRRVRRPNSSKNMLLAIGLSGLLIVVALAVLVAWILSR